MRHPERVEDYLGHIAEAIERARSYVQPLPDLHAFEQNPLVQDAVVRNIAVDLQIVWRTVQEDLPKLKQQIDQLLSQPPPAPEPEPRSR
jgi:uncharacterized protein with HEPN domain